jgi:hypothetical protein
MRAGFFGEKRLFGRPRRRWEGTIEAMGWESVDRDI